MVYVYSCRHFVFYLTFCCVSLWALFALVLLISFKIAFLLVNECEDLLYWRHFSNIQDLSKALLSIRFNWGKRDAQKTVAFIFKSLALFCHSLLTLLPSVEKVCSFDVSIHMQVLTYTYVYHCAAFYLCLCILKCKQCTFVNADCIFAAKQNVLSVRKRLNMRLCVLIILMRS